MKQGSSLFLKIVVFLIGRSVLAVCIFGLYRFANHSAKPEYACMNP